MKKKKLNWSQIKVRIENMWVPYFIFKCSPQEIKQKLMLNGFKKDPYPRQADAGVKEKMAHIMIKRYERPYQLHARIYEDSTLRVHYEPDLLSIVHKVADKVIDSFFSRRGHNLIKRTFIAIKEAVMYGRNFLPAFDIHEEESCKTGIDLGDYVTGFRRIKHIFEFYEYDVGFEQRSQMSIKDSAIMERVMRKFYMRDVSEDHKRIWN